MGIHILPPSKWSHKHIILVTLIGTMIAIAIVAVISISLSPAHIYFATRNTKSGKGVVEDTQFYNFTLVANNSSPVMAVLYGALNAEIWYSQTSWVPAVVEMDERMQQAPGNTTYINVSAAYWQTEQASNNKTAPGGAPNWSNVTVVVMAKVWFKAGAISTRSYNIRASCSNVNFHNAAAIVNCTSG